MLPDARQVAALFADFDVRELIGRGGMGAVYTAWQSSLERLVALKVLSRALLGSEDFFDRFQREARVMAQLDHPNIAKVFDSGVAASGEPFIIMELIRGEPITHFALRQSLSLQQRLELFRGTCAGVHHAHLKGIVHRDIKPSNVLVTEQQGAWTPKVIDFGLARSRSPIVEAGVEWEIAYHLLGTPGYMSPEQVCGTRSGIDTRSDIYSLGALLYELLTSVPPFDEEASRGVTPANLRQVLADLPIPRPSDRIAKLEPGRRPADAARSGKPVLAEQLRGDLDAIVLKALAKDPDQRYQTVAALMDDLRRFEIHEPVAAAEQTAGYRFRKLLRRRRSMVASAIGFVVVLLSGAALLFRESLLTRRAEHLAAGRLKQGEELIDFMLGDLYTKLDSVGRLDVLEGALERVEHFYAGPQNPHLSPPSLAHRAHAKRLLGMVRNAQGQTEEARGNYLESIELYGTATAAQPTNAAWFEALSQSWNNLAVSHHSALNVGEAESAYQKALESNARALALEPASANWIDTRASILHNLGALQEAVNRLEDAARNFGAALDLWNKLLAREPNNSGFLDHVAYVHQNLSFLHGKEGRLDLAAGANVEALRVRERLVQIDTNNVQWLVLLADIRQNISDFHLNQGDLNEAEAFLKQYLPVREQLARRDPANAWWQQSLADACRNQAIILTRRGDDEAAVTMHRRAWEISERLMQQAIPNGVWRENWLKGLKAADEILLRLARREQQQGRLEKASTHWQALLELRAKQLAENLTEPSLRHEFAVACAEQALLAAEPGDRTIAQVHAQLALFHFARCTAANFPIELPPQRLELIRSLARQGSQGIGPTEGRTGVAAEAFPAYNLLAAVINAIDGKALLLPPHLEEEIRHAAARTENRP